MRSAVRSLALVLALTCGSALAGMIPDAARDELIDRVLKSFWGRAKVSKDRYAEPASEQERTTVPVSKRAAYRTIDAGEISGLGEWCGVDWQAHFLSLTRAARSKGFNDKQIAFVSVLHGAAQGSIASALRKGQACTDADRVKVENRMRESAQQGLDGT
jgi:hypothetical protein